MSDKIIKALAADDSIRIIAAETTGLVSAASKIHKCSPTASAAFGRLLTAASIMGSMLKSESDSITVKIDGGGKAGSITATSYSDGHVKGYIGNPFVELMVNDKGKFDIGKAVGKNGFVTVIKDLGLKEPYIGKVPIYSGEIAEDIAYYFAVSEQVPSAVGLGVLVDKDCSIKKAGGFIIQMLPESSKETADLLTERLSKMTGITNLLSKGNTIEDIVKDIFKDMNIRKIDEMIPEYRCDCSREKVEKALISIGKKELSDIYMDNKEEEIKCNFCEKSYKFTHEEIGKILKNMN